jgi:hypothetical protein
VKNKLYKIGRFADGQDPSYAEDVQHFYLNTFELEPTTGPPRLRIGASGDPVATVASLSSLLAPAFFILLVLHLSRRGNAEARYQSPPVERETLNDFLTEFQLFLTSDARHDFWIHAPEEQATIVLDQHNIIYAYGPMDDFQESLLRQGFHNGPVRIPTPHVHHYHAEFDEEETRIVKHFPWKQSPLRPDDGP